MILLLFIKNKMFADTKWVIPEAVNRRRKYNQIDKRQEDKQMTYKTHRKLKNEQHESYLMFIA